MTDWLADWLTDWLTEWLIVNQTDLIWIYEARYRVKTYFIVGRFAIKVDFSDTSRPRRFKIIQIDVG